MGRDIQALVEQVRATIQRLDGVIKTSAHYENTNCAYAEIKVNFEPKTKFVRDLLHYIATAKSLPPGTEREDYEAKKRDPSTEHHRIELTYGAESRQERAEKIYQQLSTLDKEIETYIRWHQKTRKPKHFKPKQTNSRTRYTA